MSNKKISIITVFVIILLIVSLILVLPTLKVNLGGIVPLSQDTNITEESKSNTSSYRELYQSQRALSSSKSGIDGESEKEFFKGRDKLIDSLNQNKRSTVEIEGIRYEITDMYLCNDFCDAVQIENQNVTEADIFGYPDKDYSQIPGGPFVIDDKNGNFKLSEKCTCGVVKYKIKNTSPESAYEIDTLGLVIPWLVDFDTHSISCAQCVYSTYQLGENIEGYFIDELTPGEEIECANIYYFDNYLEYENEFSNYFTWCCYVNPHRATKQYDNLLLYASDIFHDYRGRENESIIKN